MITERLYYENQYLKEITCNIINSFEKDNEFYLELDKTIFFPGGGGQYSDRGLINDIKVLDVMLINDKIIHKVEKIPNNKENIICKLDWNRRFSGMQKHLAQHVLSGCFFKKYNANTCSIHLGEDINTVDIIGSITDKQLKEIEVLANKIIYKNHKVKFSFKNRKEAKAIGLRRELQTKDKEIRVVEIKDLDINACCGIHPNSTIELQMIKIKGAYPHKGNTRIEFLVGKIAVDYLITRDYILKETCRELNTSSMDIINTVNNLSENLTSLRYENNKINADIAKYEMKELLSSKTETNNMKIINKVFHDKTNKYLTKIAKEIVEKDSYIVLFALVEKEKCSFIFAMSNNIKNISMGSLLKDTITLVDGKGGGSEFLAQGAGKNLDNVNNALNYATRKVCES